MRFTNCPLIICILLFCLFACDNEKDLNHDPNFQLSFSQDTISFDTLFSGLPSTTKQLKVYNRSSQSVFIDEIGLDNTESGYRLNINGIEANRVKQVLIPAKDSLFIFIEISAQPKDRDQPRLIEDQIYFNFNSKIQKLELETWAQDVIRFENEKLLSQTWTGKRPYFIDKDLYLQQNQTLTIEAGTKVYFHKDAGMHIHGNIHIQGSFSEPVFLGAHRLEELYDYVPGQWDGLYFYTESINNTISHLQMENAITGIVAQGDDKGSNNLEIAYSQFFNFTNTGIHLNNFNLKMNDVLISNCGEQTILLEGEGDFEIYHSNFVNFWQLSSRSTPCFSYVANENKQKELKLGNCIIWGSKSNEFESNSTGVIQIENTLIRLSDEKQNSYSNIFENCLFNADPEFVDKNEHNYNLKATSPLIDEAKPEISRMYRLDFNGSSRLSDTAPDIGSLEFTATEE